MKKYVFGLCNGRHEIPVQDFIFDEIHDPTDYAGMFETADAKIPQDANALEIYVTGFTPAMMAVVRVCVERAISLVALNYDPTTRGFKHQIIMGFQKVYSYVPMVDRASW